MPFPNLSPEVHNNLKAFLMLNHLRIAGRRRVMNLAGEGKSASEIFEQLVAEGYDDEMTRGGDGKPFDADREMELCFQQGIHFVTVMDSNYPASLKEISDPPLLLYCKGEMLDSDQNAFAIVGTRHPSFYGRTQAKRFAKELAAKGLTIVSGLARGIDQIAHEAALEVSYGRTIAVLGSGLDVIYPRENAGLFERITKCGAVLSEYPLGTPPLPENFPRRNRILSGLSYGVLVVEAHSRSGSLITAHQALDQGREVFALPGPVDQLTSRGTHQLLKEGACLVEGPEDIVEAMASRLREANRQKPEIIDLVNRKDSTLIPFSPVPEKQENPSFLKKLFSPLTQHSEPEETPVVFHQVTVQPETDPLDEEMKTILEILKEEGALTQDELLEGTGLEPSKLPGLLLNLELMKKIQRDPDGHYRTSSDD